MKTTDLFKTSAKKLNESLAKTFGQKLNLESFDTEKLEDARNKLRTQVSQVRNESGFNETIENEALTKAQWMLDSINAEIAERAEHIVSDTVNEDEDEEATESMTMERDRDPEDWDEGNTEPPNNFAIYINGKKWKVLKGQGTYADDYREQTQYSRLKDMCAKKSAATGKKWEVSVTGENATESIQAEKFDPLKHVKNPTQGEKDAAKDVKRGSYADRAALLKSAEADSRLKKESAPPTAKGERMVKHIKKGYADDGKLTKKEKSIAYATAWKAHNKNESIEQTGDDMRNLREGEIQQASAIVTAKTMVDRVGRWIEELSGMENDTLLTLGDSIRDEMGQDAAKQFISACAPAIQQALENLKATREALSTSVRSLTGEEQPAEMLGAEAPEMGDEMGADMGSGLEGEEEMPAEPDAMNAGDEFGAADAAAGGSEEMGRMKRESIDRGSRLLKVLAG